MAIDITEDLIQWREDRIVYSVFPIGTNKFDANSKKTVIDVNWGGFRPILGYTGFNKQLSNSVYFWSTKETNFDEFDVWVLDFSNIKEFLFNKKKDYYLKKDIEEKAILKMKANPIVKGLFGVPLTGQSSNGTIILVQTNSSSDDYPYDYLYCVTLEKELSEKVCPNY